MKEDISKPTDMRPGMHNVLKWQSYSNLLWLTAISRDSSRALLIE